MRQENGKTNNGNKIPHTNYLQKKTTHHQANGKTKRQTEYR